MEAKAIRDVVNKTKKQSLKTSPETNSPSEEEKKSTNGTEDSSTPLTMRRSYATPIRSRAITLVNEWGITKTSEKTGIPLENLKRWRKKGPHRKKGSGRPIKHPDLELALIAYVKHQRDLKLVVSVRKVLAKARALCGKGRLLISASVMDGFRNSALDIV
jgi:hypothetical protein